MFGVDNRSKTSHDNIILSNNLNNSNTTTHPKNTNHNTKSNHFKWHFKLRNKKNTPQNTNTNNNIHYVDTINTTSNNLISNNCRCCGITLHYPTDVNRIKCLTCNTYFILNNDNSSCTPLSDSNSPMFNNNSFENDTLVSYNSLKDAIKKDEININLNKNSNISIHKSYENVDQLIRYSFTNHEVLNKCFSLNNHSIPLNFHEIGKFYSLLLKLPTKRPFFKLLTYSLYILKHPPKFENFDQVHWLLILFEIPLHNDCLINKINPKLPVECNNLCYDILKRLIGLLSSLNSNILRHLMNLWSRLPVKDFSYKINFINLYITFHLNRLFTHLIYDKLGNHIPTNKTEDDITFKNKFNFKDLIKNNDSSLLASLGFYDDDLINCNDLSSYNFNENLKISISFYSDCWHLKSACHLMSVLFYANRKHHKVEIDSFYNSLIDYINLKQDFDIWQFNNTFMEHEKNIKLHQENYTTDHLLMEQNKSYLGITTVNGVYKRSNFTICSYPFLISLGSKIKILEYESKKLMGLKAEEAFLASVIDGSKTNDIFFKLRIRRDHITNDSLRQIQSHPKSIRKSLKVEFVNEQGIDAGGLKKEWFLLLTKELFDENKGLISYKNEKKLAYFAILHKSNNIEKANSTDDTKNLELYYLLGVFIGMAIYNSIILDITFPKFLYKKLLNPEYKATIEDLKEVEPTMVSNFNKLSKLDDITNLGLKFEISINDIYDNIKNYELIPNGSNIPVDDTNKFYYINKYTRFLLDEIVDKQFTQFFNGFRHAMGTDSLNLFTPFEIQKLVTGSDEYNKENSKLDIEILKNVSKFTNCSNDDIIVIWFWKYFEHLSIMQQKRLLRFITGTDRIPALGLSSIQLKITILIDNKFSTRLPISHTCFNEICLWEYESFDILRAKLDTAINESEGFALQ